MDETTNFKTPLECLTIDLPAASAALEAAQARSLARTSTLDWAGRDADEMAPMVFPTSSRE